MISEITCEYIASARPVDRATVAEMLSNSMHRVSLCEKCQKYHIWAEVSRLEWAGAANARSEARLSYYKQVGPNAYLHRGHRKKDED